MGGQIRTDNLPYKIFIPVFGFFMPVTCNVFRPRGKSSIPSCRVQYFQVNSVFFPEVK